MVQRPKASQTPPPLVVAIREEVMIDYEIGDEVEFAGCRCTACVKSGNVPQGLGPFFCEGFEKQFQGLGVFISGAMPSNPLDDIWRATAWRKRRARSREIEQERWVDRPVETPHPVLQPT
jgi:hypothetical protein